MNNYKENDDSQIKNIQLSFSDRSLRLVSVISVMGAIIYVLNFFCKVFENTFSTLRIVNNTSFIVELIFYSGIISILIVFIIYALFYCFSEFLCFCNYSNSDVLQKFEKTANRNYKHTLAVLIICPVIFLILFILLIQFISNIDINIIIYIDIIIIFLFLLLGLYTSRENLNNFISKPKLIRLVLCWIIVGILIYGVGLNIYSSNQKAIILFNDEKDYTLQITQYINSPIDMNIIIQNSKEKKEIKISSNELTKAFVEVTQEKNDTNNMSANSKNTITYYEKYYYEYCYRLNLKEYLTDGVNTVMIKFNKDSENYKVVNQVILKDNNLIYTKKEFNINLG